MDSNDSRVLRDRHEDLEDELDRRDMTPPDAGKALLAQVTNGGSFPAAPQSFFYVTAVEVSGDEKEGSTPSFSGESADNKFLAANAGLSVPGTNDYVIIRYLGGKWVFVYNA